ncbi:MAG: L,D-transpeptidase [Nannocystales bacterium]
MRSIRLARAAAVALFILPACDRDAVPDPGPASAESQAEAAAQAPADEQPAHRNPSSGTEQAPSPTAAAEVEAPKPKVKPEDYGTLRAPQPAPADDELTVHGLAGFEVVTVYAAPNLESARLGHLRIGQRSMVTPAIPDEGEGCKKGFHGLPTGGYACASKGLLVDPEKEPYMHMPPPPPRVDSPHPYDYAVVAKEGTPMWWRTADADERMLAEEKYIATLPVEERPAPKPAKKGDTGTTTKPTSDSPDAKLPGLLDEPPAELTPEQKAELERKKAAAAARAAAQREAAAEREAELERKKARLPLRPGNPFMSKGNILSVGDRTKDKGRRWLRTARGGYVEAGRVYGKKVFDFEGAILEEGADFPFGFVDDDNAAAYELQEDGSLKRKKKLEYRSFVDLEPEPKTIGNRAYYQTTDGTWVRESHVRLAVRREMPADIDPWERWVDVSLSSQLLVAYEGDQPVFTTLVSTGKKGNKEESFRTPKGKWRIQSKHISSSMAGTTATDGDYSIQDVPWTMFFEGNYALHGAFWHTRFGRTRSHGCVNLGPTDARWLFYWTTPFIPETWHGVKSQDDSPGSMVVVHE